MLGAETGGICGAIEFENREVLEVNILLRDFFQIVEEYIWTRV